MDVDNFFKSTDNVKQHHKLKIMIFIHNAIMDGWTVKYRGGIYSFKKKHDSKKKIFSDSYLSTFVEKNAKI